MFGIHDLGLFVIAGLLLNITPGPDTAYIVGRSLQLGWRGGAAAALGIGAGCLIHVFAASIGLSAILASSSAAFAAVKLIGAAYLSFVGLKMLLSHAGGLDVATKMFSVSTDLFKVFRQGVMTNALNPKVALFFLAFLPQFVDADSPSKAAAFLALGLLFDLNGTIWNIAVAAFAARAAHRVKRSDRLVAWINKVLGGLFVYLGIRVATLDMR